jgi:hypothetical protein
VKRSQLGPGARSLERGSTFEKPRSELKRTELLRSPVSATGDYKKPLRRAPISPASSLQRAKVAGQVCVVSDCAEHHCHPAHLIDRSLGGDDDPRAVVPLCPIHHDLYDNSDLSLLEHLEPHYRAELAYAVELVGLQAAIKRITNDRRIADPNALAAIDRAYDAAQELDDNPVIALGIVGELLEPFVSTGDRWAVDSRDQDQQPGVKR